jgi:hypothetical protein
MKLVFISIGTVEGQGAKQTYDTLVKRGIKNPIHESQGTRTNG